MDIGVVGTRTLSVLLHEEKGREGEKERNRDREKETKRETEMSGGGVGGSTLHIITWTVLQTL